MSSAPHLDSAASIGDLVDWGPVAAPLDGRSMTSGRVLHKGEGGSNECGIWVCTPGRWRLSIPRDEFCHFVTGRATYRHDNGEVIEVTPGTAVTFLAGWTGECTVHETMRNIYMLV